ncbi:MAG: hypothetical protein JNL93_12735 [Pelomonas sp.]|nr:hypothetical protein [Roseateles sp.]
MRSRRRPSPLPSLGPRLALCPPGSPRLVLQEWLAAHERPVQVALTELERFSALMAAQGWPAHVSRLAYDRLYAGERFGFAKRVGHGALPALARRLLVAWRANRAPSGRPEQRVPPQDR